MKTTWDLTVLYKNDTDPQIERDVTMIEKTYAWFEKKYRGTDFTKNEKSLLSALKDFESLDEKTTPKPWWYFALKMRLNSEDTHAQAQATKIEQRLQNASNKVKFFSLAIGKIPKNRQATFLKSKLLKKYTYFLSRIFDLAQYKLTEQEEQLVGLLSQTSYTMWVTKQSQLLNQKTISFKGKQLPLSEAMGLVATLKKSDRRTLHEKINTVLKESSPFAEAEINAVYNYKKIMDERRGYAKPYSATVLGYENDEQTVEDLVDVVTKHFTLSKKFYSLHAKLLKEKKITMADRAVPIGKIKKEFDFKSSVEIVRNSFQLVDKQYAAILDSFVKNGQLDVYPTKGKNSGAFCWGVGDLPTFVFLNHVNTIDSVETLAHEMGHAIHTELSKTQPVIYSHYSIACAEVASTFFEQLVIDQLEETLPQKDKLTLLHNKLLGDISTIFRQIACFNFELELHKKIRSEGQVSKETIAKLLNKHLRAYTGTAVELADDDGYFYVTWSHIRRFFYVYSYAYGQIISRALYERWKADKTYGDTIKQFLSAGRSMSPQDIFKSIGIQTDKSFFEAGLKGIEEDIKKLERLAKKEGLLS